MKTPTIVLFVCILSVAAIGLRAQGNDGPTEANDQYRRQQAEYDQRTRAYQQSMEEDARRRASAWAVADLQQLKETEMQGRYEKLLAKWEEQAARYDRILAAMEKSHGVTPPASEQGGQDGQ